MMAVVLAVQLGIAITCFLERKKLTEVEKGVMAQGMTSMICVYQGFLFSHFEETFFELNKTAKVFLRYIYPLIALIGTFFTSL